MKSLIQNARRGRLIASFGVIVSLALVSAACQGPTVGDYAVGGSARPWFCSPTDTALNDTMGDLGSQYYTQEKGPLSAQDCMDLTHELTDAYVYAMQFPTKGVAEANGFHFLAPYIPGQGTHDIKDTNISPDVDGNFDPTRPEFLMYDGNGPNAKLDGMMFAVRTAPGSGPPEGFPGNNDHWHAHASLCFTYGSGGAFIVGDHVSDQVCTSRGGTNVDTSDVWMVHVWLPIYKNWNAPDIFNMMNPNLP